MFKKTPRPRAIPLLLLWAAAVASTPGGGATARQSDEPKTVRDFFLLVPESYVGYDRRFREDVLRGQPGAVVDMRNGYISYKATDNPEAFEFAIFRKSNGKYLAAYSVAYDPDFPETTSILRLLSYEGGRWSDVTRQLLPRAFDRRLTYKLPRQGRSIVVTDEKGRELYTLTWANDKFNVGRTASK